MSIRRADSGFVAGVSSSPALFLVHHSAAAEGSYTARVRGTVTDPTHAAVNNAEVSETSESTSTAATRRRWRIWSERVETREPI